MKVGKLAAACCRFLSTLAELASSCSRRLSDAKLAIISDVVLGVADGQGGGPRAIDAQALARVSEFDYVGYPVAVVETCDGYCLMSLLHHENWPA